MGTTVKYGDKEEILTGDTPQTLVMNTAGKFLNNNVTIINDGSDSPERAEELFWVTADTTYSEITEALAEDKLPVLKYNNKVYIYSSIVNNKYTFTMSDRSKTHICSIDENSVRDYNDYTYYYVANWNTSSYNTVDALFEEGRYIVARRGSNYFQFRIKDSQGKYQFWAVDYDGGVSVLKKLILYPDDIAPSGSANGWREIDYPITDSTNYTHETWTFTLEDGSTVDKEVMIWTGA